MLKEKTMGIYFNVILPIDQKDDILFKRIPRVETKPPSLDHKNNIKLTIIKNKQ